MNKFKKRYVLPFYALFFTIMSTTCSFATGSLAPIENVLKNLGTAIVGLLRVLVGLGCTIVIVYKSIVFFAGSKNGHQDESWITVVKNPLIGLGIALFAGIIVAAISSFFPG